MPYIFSESDVQFVVNYIRSKKNVLNCESRDILLKINVCLLRLMLESFFSLRGAAL